MSDETTDRELPTAPRDTNPMLAEILAEVRALRGVPEQVAALRTELRAGFAELRRELSETRATYRAELSLETANLNARLADLERRLLDLENAGRPQ
jgi:hypothetical protein